MSTPIPRLWSRLARIQSKRPFIVLLVAALLVVAALPLVRRLRLNSDWTALLPKNKPSVHDLERVRGRMSGLTTLTLAIESKDTEALKRFARDLVPRVQRLGTEGVRSIDWNVGAYEQFLEKHKHLYVDLQDLRDVRDALQERLDYERMSRNPFYVDLSGEAPPKPQQLIDEIKEKQEAKKSKVKRFPGGFYMSREGDLLVVFVRADISGGDKAQSDRLLHAVDEQVQKLKPAQYAKDLKVEYAGDLIGAREEHEAIARELVIATVATIFLVLLSIYALFRRVRAIVVLGAALITPVVVTFAFAQLSVKFLNTSTAFLGSIVIGNGINPMIIWLARYFEERRKGGDPETAVAASHAGTWTATITASLAATCAYGSLVITDFRGFRDFGIIGGVGMVLCWLATVLILPSLAAAFEQARSIDARRELKKGVYGVALWRVLDRYRRAIVVVSGLLFVVAAAATAFALASDPLEYDFRNLRSVREGSTNARKIHGRVNEIAGKAASGMAIAMLAPSRDEAERLQKKLEQRRAKGAPFGTVRGIGDLLPKDQDEKIPVLREIRKLLTEARSYGSESEQKQIDEYMPPEAIERVSFEDLPASVARPFTERDGTRGRILFVEEQKGASQWDGRYLVRWSRALRDVRTEDGLRPPLAGRAPVFADMIEVIWADGPKVMAASFFVTFLIVLITFRSAYQLAFTIGALLLGIAWMAGAMALGKMKINFLNFVAFPITFGIGVDYSVNVMRRVAEELRNSPGRVREAVQAAVEETGGAVVLCSLTTIIGYLSLFTSANQALNSFGIAMTISEITCLFAATLTMPAAMLIFAGQKAARAKAANAPDPKAAADDSKKASLPT